MSVALVIVRHRFFHKHFLDYFVTLCVYSRNFPNSTIRKQVHFTITIVKKMPLMLMKVLALKGMCNVSRLKLKPWKFRKKENFSAPYGLIFDICYLRNCSDKKNEGVGINELLQPNTKYTSLDTLDPVSVSFPLLFCVMANLFWRIC